MKIQRKLTKIVLLLFFCSISAGQLIAQQIQIQGRVADALTNEALPGVNVVIKGTTTGISTDANGEFTIPAPKGAILTFSFVGFRTQEITVENSTRIDIKLEQEISKLDEIVIVGYGTVKKSDATGSVVAIDSKDFNKGAITSPQDLLVGKSAGVIITTAGGAPGSGATIRVRGGSSLNASNDPLMIVDGIPLDNNNVSGSSNFLSFINPNDIESFTVLKDASATAIYGSRASNGVIIITTKKGKAGSPVKITYNANTSVASPIKYMDVYTGDELRQLANDPAHANIFAEGIPKLGTHNTDWQKEIFRNAVSQDHNLSVTGAYKSFPYRVSVGYTDQNGILLNTGLKRLTGSVSLTPSFLKDNLKFNINAKGMNTENNFGDVGAIGSAINMDPTQPVKDGNPNSAGYFQWVNYGASLGTSNPVEQTLDDDNKATVKRFIGNFQADYKLPFISELHANLNLATDYTTSTGHNNRPTTAPVTLTNGWGRLNDFHGKNYNNLLDFYLNYLKDIDPISSKIDATAGYSWQHFKRQGDNYTRGIQDATHPYQLIDSTSFITESFLVSFFGRLNYTLLNKYLLTFTIRDDGSSHFSKDDRWGLFPSAAFAWKISEESFLENVKAISELKLRLGWGVTGQQDFGLISNDYPNQAIYINSVVGSYYPIDGQYLPTLRPNAYDPNIKWEETTTKNIGLDFGFLKGRINGSFDVYMRTTDNLIETVTIPSGSNFSNTLLTNVGSLDNKGAELSLNLIPVSKKDVFLTFGFNLSYNKNKITKLLLINDPTYIGILEGGDSFTGRLQNSKVGYPAHSFFMNKQVYDANGNPVEGLYVDLSGNGGTISGNNADKYIFHNPAPDYLMGFSTRFSYKNLDISASTRASIGNYVYNQVASGASYDQMYQIGYWHNEPTYLNDTKFVKRQFTSDYFVQNASFLKLDNVSAGYNFKNLANKLNLRLSFTVQNLATITKYKGIDPEIDLGQGGNKPNPGVDNNFYPRPRTFILGLSLSY